MGAISGNDAPEVLTIVDQTIYNNRNILVAVDVDDNGRLIDDDGCGDGRAVLTVFTNEQIFNRSLERHLL
jgi:hypothetical protein